MPTTQYHQLGQENVFDDDSEVLSRSSNHHSTLRNGLWVSCSFNVVLALISLFFLMRHTQKDPDVCLQLRRFEDIYDDVPSSIECSTIRYDTNPVPPPNPDDFKTFWGRQWFEGTEEEINGLWRNISSMRLLSITAQEASRLPASTAQNGDSPGTFAVMPQVLHDIHCLNYVRNHALGYAHVHNQETPSERLVHVEHCLGILRQSVLCEGNLQPVVFTTVDGVPHPNPGATPRQCRDWGALWDWARQRNITSGTVKITS